MSATATMPVKPDAMTTPNEPTLKERVEAKKASDEQSYRDAVARFVAGLAEFDDAMMRTINRTGRAMDEFQADVEMLKQRFQAVRDIEAAGKMQGDIEAASKKHREALDAVEKLKVQQQEELKAAMAKAAEAHDVSRRLEQQRKDLAKSAGYLESTNDTANYDAIRAKLQEIERLEEQYERFQDLIGRADREAAKANAYLRQQFEDAKLDNNQAREPEYIDLMKDSQYVARVRQRDGLRKQIDDLKDEIESLRPSRVDPLAMKWTQPRA